MNIQARRHKTGWSVLKLAEKAGISAYVLRQVERGRNRGPATLQKIEEALVYAAQHPPTSAPRGFAKISPELQRSIASAGGKHAHRLGRAHKFNSAEARAAGHKGGVAVAQDRDHMSIIGRAGGLARGR
jgi:transcriptional regulator with XRE-family HTH domain